MADSDFKSKNITFPAGWKAASRGGVIGKHKYKPDRSFKDDHGTVVCILESSSTNDRKVGVGELCLADEFFTDTKTDGILIFSLCGKSAYPPRADTQARYLEPYFRHLKAMGKAHGVREVYFISESKFSELEWVALDQKFKDAAHAITA